jgi:hypothetical protein
MPEHPHGKVDWGGQHCRFCRFLILDHVSPPFEARIQADWRDLAT